MKPSNKPNRASAGSNHSPSPLWAAAIDLSIEPHIMKRILNYPASCFYLNHRIIVDLEVVLKVCPRGPLAARVRHLMANSRCVLHPLNACD